MPDKRIVQLNIAGMMRRAIADDQRTIVVTHQGASREEWSAADDYPSGWWGRHGRDSDAGSFPGGRRNRARSHPAPELMGETLSRLVLANVAYIAAVSVDKPHPASIASRGPSWQNAMVWSSNGR